MLDLFDTPVVSGLSQRQDIIRETEEADLIARIDACGLSPFRFQQWTGKRLTRSYGWSYDFATGRFTVADPIPQWLLPLRERASAFVGLDTADLVQALLIHYDPGAGIGWHKDRPVFEHVVGVSLGHPATIRLRRRRGIDFERARTELVLARSALTGEVRHEWEHSIVAIEMPRWSITFRSLAARDRRT